MFFISSSKLLTPRSFSTSVTMNLCWLTSFVKFNIDRVIPKPRGINLVSTFQLSTFIK